MFAKITRRTSELALACALAAFAAGGVANAQLVQYVSDSYPGMIEQLPFHAPAPIAREVRYTFYLQTILNGKVQDPAFATNESSAGSMQHALPSIALPGPTSGKAMSDVYERKQADARADGNRVMEQHYASMSYSALQSEIATGRLNAQIGLMTTSLNALATIGQALRDESARTLANWTTQTTGAVAPTAPPGSVLHLAFFEFVYSSRFALESRCELIVTATLETPGSDGPIQSAATVELFTYKKNNPEAANNKPGYVPFAGALAVTGRWKISDKKLDVVPLGVPLAIVANSTMTALYAQLEK